MRFPPQVELISFRIAQALCNNALKHSKASQITLELDLRNSVLLMTVTDNGQGFDIQIVRADPGKGLGLKNIESRLAIINARILYDVGIGKGSTFLIESNLENL